MGTDLLIGLGCARQDLGKVLWLGLLVETGEGGWLAGWGLDRVVKFPEGEAFFAVFGRRFCFCLFVVLEAKSSACLVLVPSPSHLARAPRNEKLKATTSALLATSY